jgi:hypothetical protein
MAVQLFCLGRFFSFLSLYEYTVGKTPWTGDLPVARPLPIHRTTHTDIHVLSGIGTHDPSIWAGEDCSWLRSRDHCDGQCYISVRPSVRPSIHIHAFKMEHIFLCNEHKRISFQVPSAIYFTIYFLAAQQSYFIHSPETYPLVIFAIAHPKTVVLLNMWSSCNSK